MHWSVLKILEPGGPRALLANIHTSLNFQMGNTDTVQCSTLAVYTVQNVQGMALAVCTVHWQCVLAVSNDSMHCAKCAGHGTDNRQL